VKRKPFPVGAEAEYARFVADISKQMLPRLQELHAYLDSPYCTLDSMLRIQRECWDALDLLWKGSDPEHKERMQARLLAGGWEEFCELRAKNQARADELIRLRKERDNAQS